MKLTVGELILSILLLLSANALALAQSSTSSATSAAITGIVKDPQGASIAGATITARQLETNFTRTAVTDESGAYQLVQVPPGSYQVTVSAGGFANKIVEIAISIGQTALTDLTLELSGSDNVVVIKADTTAAVEQHKTEKSSVVVRSAIDALPINRRNFLDFTLTTSGVVQDRLPLQGAQANSGLNFNGQNARQNNITIDGIDNNDLFSGSVRASYSQEAVQEFQVVSNSFSAEFGRAQGGVVNIVTRAGTNEVHGTLFLFNRNDKISARNAFATERPPFSQYQFGASLGGPVKRDRAFYFASFERLSVADTINVNIPDNFVRSLNRVGFPTRVGSIPFSEGSSSLLTRGDVKITNNDFLNIRYNYAGVYNGALESFGGVKTESAGGLQRLRDDNISIANTYVSAGGGFINETRFLFARRDLTVDPLDNNGPRLNITTPVGTITAGRSLFLPNPRLEQIYQVVSNVSLPRGKHQLKLGGDYLHINLPADSFLLPVGVRGQAFFQPLNFAPPLPSFTAIELFDPALRTPQQQALLLNVAQILTQRFPGFPLLDLTRLSIPLVFIQGFGNPTIALKYDYISGFAQDDIKVSNRLLVRLGVRYDQERITFVPRNRGNLSPRVAFSYRIKENLNFHSSYGIYHGVTPFVQVLNIALDNVNGFELPVFPFPFSIIPFAQPGNKFPESNALPTAVPFIPQLAVESQVQRDYRNGYSQQVHTGFDYLIGRDTLISISYQYVRGLKLYLNRDVNPVVRPVRGDAIASRINGRIDPRRGTVFELSSVGDSYYNALTIEARRNLGNRLGFLASYTFSKTLDTFVDSRLDLTAFADPLNLKGEKGFSVQDVRNRFVLSSVWQLDYTKHPLLRDFRLSAIATLESGRPYNLRTGVDLDMNGELGTPGDRPLGIARNSGILPGFAALDMRLTRKIKLNERVAIEGLFEVFNLLNRVNISADFGANEFPPDAQGRFNLPAREGGRFIFPRERYNNAFAPRRLQFGFRLTY